MGILFEVLRIAQFLLFYYILLHIHGANLTWLPWVIVCEHHHWPTILYWNIYQTLLVYVATVSPVISGHRQKIGIKGVSPCSHWNVDFPRDLSLVLNSFQSTSMRYHRLDYNFYVDDGRLCITFIPKGIDSIEEARAKFEACIVDLH